MLTCASKHGLRSALYSLLTLLAMGAVVFYVHQNKADSIGGAIALPKLLWLALALLFWYLLPLLFACDARLAQARVLYFIFIINMWARAFIELWMMYLSHNWHPYYGIGHDAFSAALALIIAYRIPAQAPLARLQTIFFQVLFLMFLIELGFAGYMLFNVQSDQAVFFVPDQDSHRQVLMLTWAVVGILTLYLIALIREWLYVSFKR